MIEIPGPPDISLSRIFTLPIPHWLSQDSIQVSQKPQINVYSTFPEQLNAQQPLMGVG
jgi:hypothetical protein